MGDGMRSFLRIEISVGAVLMCASGCATIVAGDRQTITVDSDPPSATVCFDGQVATAPATFQVPKGRDYTIELYHGTTKRVVTLNRRFEPLSLLNLIPPLWPGFLVDTASGAITRYEPTTMTVTFPRHTMLTQFGP